MYAFVREAGSAGLALIWALDPVRVLIPTAGEYGAYVALEHEDTQVLFETLTKMREIEDVLGVDAYLPLVDPEYAPMPMPTRIVAEAYVGFALLATEPGATAEVYAAIHAGELAGAAAIVSGPAPLVLAEVTAGSLGGISQAVDVLGSIEKVRDLTLSVGVPPAGPGPATGG